MLRDVANLITATFPKSIVVDEDTPRDLWPIHANPTQIHQVLLNLCVNARDAMPSGGTLRLRAENCVLDAASAARIDGARPGAWLVLHVEDTGTGIPPEMLPRIWDSFFSTKPADKGTGLGLSTVRGIVETHHGFITLQTELNYGTTFRVYLPPEESAVAGDARASAPSAGSGRGELILFVDDEVLIRDTADAILRDAGYRVVTAADGYEATARFEARAAEIALIITDLDMPNVDGETLASAIHVFYPALKILAISGLASRGMKKKTLDFASAYLAKPFTAQALLHSVDQLLHGKTTPA